MRTIAILALFLPLVAFAEKKSLLYQHATQEQCLNISSALRTDTLSRSSVQYKIGQYSYQYDAEWGCWIWAYGSNPLPWLEEVKQHIGDTLNLWPNTRQE